MSKIDTSEFKKINLKGEDYFELNEIKHLFDDDLVKQEKFIEFQGDINGVLDSETGNILVPEQQFVDFLKENNY